MKYFNIKILKIYFITLLNLVKIYLLIKKKHRKNRKLKVLIFYFPLKAYNENLMELISILKKNTNFLVLLIRNKYSEYSQVKQKHSYLLDFNFLRFIPFSNNFLSKIDLFISAYAVYIFPPNSKNIFISHDITDAPMVNKEIEKKIFLYFLIAFG